MSPEVQSLQTCLKSVPDPRKRRGIRFPFVSMLMLAIIGLVSRQTTLQGIIDHAGLQWAVLGEALGFVLKFGAPHATTLSRLLARVSTEALQTAFETWLRQLIADLPLEASVDGKYPHQSRDENGEPFGVLNVFAHDLKVCLRQWIVSEKTAEPSVLKAHLSELFTAYPQLQALTGDALFAQRGLCEVLVEARRGYLWRIKGNQPDVQEALQTTFDEVAQRPPDASSMEKHEGAIETRRLWIDQVTADYVATELNFAGAQQVARLDKLIHDIETGQDHCETWYLVSFDPRGPLSADDLLKRIRGHWSVENSLHHVEDRSWGEDKHTLRRPGLGPCFSMLLSMALTILRLRGDFNAKLSMPRRAKRCEANPRFAVSLVA
jgi:predicted transposase YbfD/YdcC